MMEKIPVVIVKFTHGESDLWFHKEQWDEMGGYKGFLKSCEMSIKDIHSVVHKRVLENKFPTAEWPN